MCCAQSWSCLLYTSILQADARVGSGLPDLRAGGELGVLVGHVAAPAVPVGHMGVDRRVEVILAADVQEMCIRDRPYC